MDKVWRVQLIEEICGTIYVTASDSKEAEQKALHSPDVDWNDDSETHVCLVEQDDNAEPDDVNE